MEHQNEIYEPMTDKAFLRLALTSGLAIFLCIVCLCLASYNWYLAGLPNNNKAIMENNCKLEVEVYCDGTLLEEIERGVELNAGSTYTVTLKLPGDAASGYCLISSGKDTYYTDYIIRHTEEDAKTISFELTVEETQVVSFTPRIGVYNLDSDVVNGELSIP